MSRDADQKTTPPRTDSMVQLLLQGLHNKDRKILDSVLDRADEDLIENTVKKLPVEFVIPLITELQHYIKVNMLIVLSHNIIMIKNCLPYFSISDRHVPFIYSF